MAGGPVIAEPVEPGAGTSSGATVAPLRPRHAVDPAGYLYGALVAAAVLTLVDDPQGEPGSRGQTSGEVMAHLAVVVGTLLIYFVVHVYTRVLGTRATAEPTDRRVWSGVVHECSILAGGVPAMAVYLACALVNPEHAGTWALWVTTVLFGVLTWLLARRAGVRGFLLGLEAVAMTMLGYLMIVLKAALQ
ncbi:hypothetical protein JL107_08250 [Nakamurella flavida]|uniref:Uncharacterized protein n=1 Tax=Nakamurella flavida TaxID=363630 RepID=A0A939C075_9ACTN|nr:hypothetical protein [Nakamurella flavida]MBM9476428.1 hypothetical protein [Nakamurella flavida]MDP9779471.1 hypothetical protein [Nakamurella flavida]